MHTAFGWLPEGRRPGWTSGCVRRTRCRSTATAGSTRVYNVSRFESEGLPLETAWHTCLGQTFRRYWMDPKRLEIRPECEVLPARHYGGKEAARGRRPRQRPRLRLDLPGRHVVRRRLPEEARNRRRHDQEAGFRPKASPINYTAEFIPKYREGRGQHEGVAYKIGPGFATDAVARLVYDMYSKGGQQLLRLQRLRPE